MNRRTTILAMLTLALCGLLAAPWTKLQADTPATKTDSHAGVPPKPLAENTRRGLAYLIEQQNENGGWGQGGGWRQAGGGRVEGQEVKDPPDLGNTCIATLALIRAGHTTQEGAYAKNVAKAVAFICEHVEQSDADSIYVTDVRDTQLQVKIGHYVDTFLAGLVLSELKGRMPADGSDKRLVAALDKVVHKIEKNQQADGTFVGNSGWASILSQTLCTKALNRAAQNGAAVRSEVLNRDFAQATAGLNKATGEFKPAGVAGSSVATVDGRGPIAAAGPVSDAGVNLYTTAGNVGRINDLGNTSVLLKDHAEQVLADAKSSDEERGRARADLDKVAEVKDAQKAAVSGILGKLDDKQFLAGFGNNGGEEFLSYMNISETMVVAGGQEWLTWEKSIAENLDRVQNKDGSWSGDHCITGRTFCTGAALLTLMADRAPVPVAAKIKSQN